MVQNVSTSLAYYPEKLGITYNAAILKFRKTAHPFGLKLQQPIFFTASQPLKGGGCELTSFWHYAAGKLLSEYFF